MIYLACPYRHIDATVRAERLRIAQAVHRELAAARIEVFSPLSHGPWDDIDGDYWLAVDLKVLPVCSVMVVLTLPGWRRSVGVATERQRCDELGIRVELLDPDPIEAVVERVVRMGM